MPLNIAGTATPQAVVVQGLPAAPTSVAQAQAVAPAPVDVSAQTMPPVVFAGFTLAKIVLAITAGSIVIFVLYLFAMDWIIGNDVRNAYQKILSPSRVGTELLTVAELERFSTDLGNTRKNPTAPWTTEAVQNGQNVLTLVNELPSVPDDQKTQLKNCLPPALPADASRDDKLDRCLQIVGGIKQAALEAVVASTDAKVATDSAVKIGEQRQSLHTFWVQAAQLVLLNLLLPLLTALFGYIFGTQQPQKTA
jgi:hypothetical protein